MIPSLYDYKKFAILYVDDEEKSLKYFTRAFDEHFTIYTATNAADGFRLLEQHRDEPFAHAFKQGEAQADASFRRYIEAANVAHALGMGVNAGHDLDLDNLTLFRTLPHLDEVSIGHALISHALYVGLDRAVRDYLRACTPVP